MPEHPQSPPSEAALLDDTWPPPEKDSDEGWSDSAPENPVEPERVPDDPEPEPPVKTPPAGSQEVQVAIPTVLPAAYRERLARMKNMFERAWPLVEPAAPRGIKVERIFASAYLALARSPQLLECDGLSILRGVITGAQLGLDVTGIGGQGWLVPYKNRKTGKSEAVFIAGYRGQIQLALRSPKVVAIEARLVRSKDRFSLSYGLNPVLEHLPFSQANENGGEVEGAYAIAVIAPHGYRQVEYMPVWEIEEIRKRSRAKDAGPWSTDYGEMCRKTVVRRLCKYLPFMPDLQFALDVEDFAEGGEGALALPGELPELGEAAPAEEPPASRTEAVLDKVKRGPGRHPGNCQCANCAKRRFEKAGIK